MVMASSWLYVIPVYLVGRFILQMIPLMFYVDAVFIINLAVALISFLIFRRSTKGALKINMTLMAIFTAAGILSDMDTLPGFISWGVFLALLILSVFGRRWEK